MELKDYVRLLRINWRGVTAIIAGCVLLGAGWTFTREPVYAANASGYVTAGSSAQNGALDSVNDSLAKSKAKTYLVFASSRAVAEKVATELELDTSPNALVSQITATQPSETAYIEIEARAASPALAQELADAWVAALAETVEEIENPSGEGKSNLRIAAVNSAVLPDAPISPDPVRNFALALAVGLLLALGYAVLRGTFDRRLRSKEDVESKFDVAVLGQIPDAPVLKREIGGRSQLAVDADSAVQGQGASAEAFRKVRTNLTYMDVDNPPRVIVVSSPMPGDGKSTVAANLVATIERSGQPVILIDGDLRRPSVASGLGLVEGIGLTDVLTGKITVEEALQRIPGHDNLRVLAAGSIPPNPSELLGSQAMRNLLARLAQNAMVIVDAPPLLPVTDGAILAARTDGAVVVVSAAKTRDHQLESALESLQQVDGRTLGVIVNRVPRGSKFLGYGSYGAYGAYGSYGSYESVAPAAEKAGPPAPRHSDVGGGKRSGEPADERRHARPS